MAFDTYTDLVAAIPDWLNRSGHTAVTNRIPDFIRLAQIRLNRYLEINGKEVVENLTVDSESESVPTGTEEIISITDADGCKLSEASLADVLNHSTAGSSTLYAHVGDLIYFGPPQSSSTTMRIHFIKQPTNISATNETNWFTTNSPDLLLALSLYEAYLFLKDDQRAAVWMNNAKPEMEMLRVREWKKRPASRIQDETIMVFGGPLV